MEWKKGQYRYLGIGDFYKMFLKRKIFFTKKDFGYDLNTLKRKITISEKKHEEIILEYFSVYFTELLYQNKKKYYFLSGLIEKCVLKPRFNRQFGRMNPPGVGFVWYLRPQLSYLTNIEMRMLNKKDYTLRKIMNQYRKISDLDVLKPVSLLFKELRESRLKYKDDD